MAYVASGLRRNMCAGLSCRDDTIVTEGTSTGRARKRAAFMTVFAANPFVFSQQRESR